MKTLIKDMVSRFFKNEVARSGVSLAYFFLFTIFPVLISINALLGAMELNDNGLTGIIAKVFPAEIVTLLEGYTEYITSIQSPTLLLTGIFWTIFSLSRVVNTMVYAINRAYETNKQLTGIKAFLRSIFFTVILGISVIATLFILMAGKGLLSELALYSGWWQQFIEIWNIARFLVLGILIFTALSMLYYMLPAVRPKIKDILPGTAFALFVWLGMTAGFSYYVANIADYSRLYGSLGVIIMLLFWLYLTGVVLVLGGELNASLAKRKLEENLLKTRQTV